MMFHPHFLVAAAAMLAIPAWAQGGDPTAMARTMTANQVGILQYCQAQGYSDAAPVAAERAALARMPSSGDAKAEDAAEALGRSGSMSVNGNATPLASMASSHNTTVAVMCQQLASSATQSAAALSQTGMPMQMPAGIPPMPGGMPQMPGGMPRIPSGIPSISTMPAVPGAAAPTR